MTTALQIGDIILRANRSIRLPGNSAKLSIPLESGSFSNQQGNARCNRRTMRANSNGWVSKNRLETVEYHSSRMLKDKQNLTSIDFDFLLSLQYRPLATFARAGKNVPGKTSAIVTEP